MARSLFRIILQVIRGTTEVLRSDMLFGHFCWALADLRGEGALQEFLATCQGPNPGVVFSDAFPGDTLPRPDFPFFMQQSGDIDRDRLLQLAREAKRFRSLHYLPKSVVLQILKGEQLELEGLEGGGFTTYVTQHVSMDRRNNRALDGALYSLREVRPQAGFLTVYVSVLPAWQEIFEKTLDYMVDQGIGGSRSIGRGRFEITSISLDSSFENVAQPNAFMSLSAFVPARNDPTDGWYRLGLKRGVAGRGFEPVQTRFSLFGTRSDVSNTRPTSAGVWQVDPQYSSFRFSCCAVGVRLGRSRATACSLKRIGELRCWLLPCRRSWLSDGSR